MLTPLEEALDPGRFGGKAAALAQAMAHGLPVPGGWALSVDAVRRVVAGESVSLGGATWWAVRSSAVGEDGDASSFAGLHRTRLFVRSGDLAEAVREVHASGSSPAAVAYRRRLGLPLEARMAVVVQPMIEAEVAGVLFTRHPIGFADERVIEASWGLGEAVVAGLVTPDHFRFSRGGALLERRLGEKDRAVAFADGGGTREGPVPRARQQVFCLGDARLDALLELAGAVEGAFEGAHDLEWAFAAGEDRPWLLQRRPITRPITHANTHPPDG